MEEPSCCHAFMLSSSSWPLDLCHRMDNQPESSDHHVRPLSVRIRAAECLGRKYVAVRQLVAFPAGAGSPLFSIVGDFPGKACSPTPLLRGRARGEKLRSVTQSCVGLPAIRFNFLPLPCKTAIASSIRLLELPSAVTETVLSACLSFLSNGNHSSYAASSPRAPGNVTRVFSLGSLAIRLSVTFSINNTRTIIHASC